MPKILLIVTLLFLIGCGPTLTVEGDRRIRDAQFEKIVLSSDIADSLYRGNVLRIDGDHLYVIDTQRMSVIKFTKHGEWKASIGNGIGRGPGEHEQLAALHVSNDTIYTIDVATLRLSAFSSDGTFLYSHPVKNHVRSISRIGGLSYTFSETSQPLFQAFDKNGNAIYEFGQHFPDLSLFTGSINGTIHAYNQKLIYAPQMSSEIIQFGLDGAVIDTLHLPDMIPLTESKIWTTPRGAKVWAPPALLPHYHHHSIIGSTIMTFTTIASDVEIIPERIDRRLPPFDRYIDFISLETGRYLYSIKADSIILPLRESTIMGFDDNVVYGRNYDGDFEAWRIRQN